MWVNWIRSSYGAGVHYGPPTVCVTQQSHFYSVSSVLKLQSVTVTALNHVEQNDTGFSGCNCPTSKLP